MGEGDKERVSLKDRWPPQTPRGGPPVQMANFTFHFVRLGRGTAWQLSFPKRATVIPPPPAPCSFTM